MKAFPSISVQVMLAVLVTVISVLGFSSIIELNILQRREIQTLQQRGTLTTDRIANSLAYPLWNLNRQEVERVVLDEIGSADVLRIQVFDENDALYVGRVKDTDGVVRNIDARAAGTAFTGSAGLYSYSGAINFRDNGIGRVAVDITDRNLQAELRKLKWGIAIKLLLLAVVLSVVLFVVLRGLVIRPLSTLKSWVENIPLGSELRPPRFKRSGEINSLGEAFGRLSVNLQKKNEELESEEGRLRELNQQMQVEIEERKQAERRASELAYFLSKMREAVIVTDLEHRFIYWNEGAEHTFGWSAADAIGKTSKDLFPDSPLAELEAPRQVVAETGEWHGELSNLDKGGRAFFTESSWTLVRNAAGEPEAIVSISADITERKQAEDALRASEQRFADLFNLSPYRMGIVRRRDGVILDINDCWVRENGVPRDEAVNHPIFEWEPKIGAEATTRIRQILEGGKPFSDLELRFKTMSGDDRVTLASGELVEIDGDSCFLWAANDITERQQAEVALRTSEEQLRALSARVQSAREEEGTRIAREIHDELGSALTGLKWDLEKMEQTLSRSENDAAVNEARTRIGTMTGLIEATINTVRRISSDLRPSILDDLGLVAAIEWQVQQFQARTGIEYVWNTGLETAELNRESSTAVFRIFQEILTNVLRHSGASRISVELQKCEGHLDLQVKDNGRGISEREKSNTRSLGLLGMKERALLVGGEVIISGTSGAGTTVVVRVPATA